MNPDDIRVGKTYIGPPRPWAPNGFRPERTVLEIGPGFSPYGLDSDVSTFDEVVRYRVTHHKGNTARLRGREYTCRLATFAAWARLEAAERLEGSRG